MRIGLDVKERGRDFRSLAVDLAEGQLDGPVLAIAGGLVPVDEPSGLFVRIFFPGRHLVAEAPVDRNPSSSKMPLANNQAA